jgi:tetratricopeptide (TPR) repeat protein
MLMTTEQGLSLIPATELDRIRTLVDQGLCFRAFEVAREFGPLARWTGPSERLLAGRLAPHLGAPRLGSALHHRAWREDPTNPTACYYRARMILGHRGPLEAWRFMQSVGPLDGADNSVRSDWMANHSCTLARLRDFDAAESWLEKAERTAPESAWLLVERSDLYELEDRYQDALAVARESLCLKPWYRPAVQAVARCLERLDRQVEAVELLAEASDHIESTMVLAQQGILEQNLGRYQDARRTWQRFEERAPLIERRMRRWLIGRQSDAAYGCGDLEAAAAFAKESAEPFFLAIAARIENQDLRQARVLLDVGFVNQHFQTCAPATLTAIARYWKMPADHLAIADAICYDGTPNHRERYWAEQNGFLALEFTVTWSAAISLLNQGIPFTLTTVATQSAHLQAVIGYDEKRGTLLIRDPSMPADEEVLAEPFLANFRSVGPRGLALVPRALAHRAESLDLPEARLYDEHYQLQIALEAHDRDRAELAHQALQAAAPGHRLELVARHALAHYDADPSEVLAATALMLEQFPDNTNLRLAQLACLRTLGRRDERLARYRELCSRPAADPILCRQYARELQPDARERETVLRLIGRTLRARPTDAIAIWMLGEARWSERRFSEAIELYRFAACVDDKDEALAYSYWNAARHLHREDETLGYLQDRFRRFAGRSAHPARTLYWAFSQLERMQEAFDVLEQAVRMQPGDGDLLLFLAQSRAAHGEFELAESRLNEAKGLCRRGDWMRIAAQLASMRGDLIAALNLWREVLLAEPCAADANRAVARLIAETDSRTAALEHLARACERFPHNYPLHQLRIEWLRESGPAATEPAVRRLLEIHPADAWGQRELALALANQGRHDEAAAAMELASQLEPGSAVEAHIRGDVLAKAGHKSAAREAYREAIRRSADDEFAIASLINSCESRADRAQALRFIESELTRQVIFGDGLLAFAERARGTLEPEQLIAVLRQALEVRPDLWHAWSALITELANRGEVTEALELAERAVAMFPLLPRMWLDLAAVRRTRNERALEIEAISRALRINPGFSHASRQLAAALQKDGKDDEARTVLERAISLAPLDAANHGHLAFALWRLDRKEQAIERLIQALKLEPDYDWAWDSFRSWAAELERPKAPAEIARILAETHSGDASVFLHLAMNLNDPADRDEKLAALDRSIALDPHQYQAHDLKAVALAEADRWEEAEAACRPSVYGEHPPIFLRGRAAWIDAERGNFDTAMSKMRAALADDSDYYWGWQRLADWTRNHDSPERYLEAAEAMVRLSPESAFAAAYRGEARLKAGDRDGAREEFRRAHRLSPEYGFAAFELFDLELSDGQHDAASTLLDALKTHNPGEFVDLREVQLCLATRDLERASTVLAQLCRAPLADSEWPLSASVTAFVESGFAKWAESILEKALDEQGTHPAVGYLWAERCAARKHWKLDRRLEQLRQTRPAVGQRATFGFFQALGRARLASSIRRGIRRHRSALTAETQCWGIAGYCLIAVNCHRENVEWLSDWADRPDVAPWMLSNLAQSLRAVGNESEASRVSRFAVTLKRESATSGHELWLILDDLMAGPCPDASDRIGRLDRSILKDADDVYLLGLATILADLRQSPPESRRKAGSIAAREIAALGRRSPVSRDLFLILGGRYRQAIAMIAEAKGGISGKFWWLWRRLRPSVS